MTRPQPYSPLSPVWRVLGIALMLLFMAGGLFSGYLFYETVRALVASIPASTDTNLPVIARYDPNAGNTNSGNGGNPTTTNPAPSTTNPQQTEPTWDKTGRINFLLMGVDRRPGETGPTRSDTMIVVTVDPATKSVGMLSIPRDLWVPIPGYYETRINEAYFIGDWKKYPGGGPALAKKTIQYNFGIPINYYVTINFVGFRRMVDTLGGLTIESPKDINDPCYPDDTYGCLNLTIAKGVHHFNGDEVLQYARTRHQDSDFGRMKRQQQVLKAIKDQALSLDTIAKLPALWAAREDMVQTDLTIDRIIALAQLAKDVKSENIFSAVVDDSMALGITTPSGAQVLWPDREKIRLVVEQLMKAPDGAPVQAQAPEQPKPQPQIPQQSEQMKKLAGEAARIEISNGTDSEGLSTRVADWLKSLGFNVVRADNADRRDYAQTVVVESNDRPYTKSLLLNIFHVAQKVRQNPNPKSDADLRIIIGQDFDEKVIPDSR